jgi:alpha-beta hydrolase superfamily lysophospholipase
MLVLRHCTAALVCAALMALAPRNAAVAQDAAPAPGDATYVVFLGTREVGREQASLARTASGWKISSTGRLLAPLNFTNNRFEVTYAPDWQPIELRLDARMQDRSLTLATSFGTTTAINEITQNAVTNTKTDQVSARTVVLPNNFFAAYEALAVRLSRTAAGADIPVYVAPQTEIRLTVTSVEPVTYQTPAGAVQARRYAVRFQNPAGPVDAEVTIDGRQRFAQLAIPVASLTVSRQDLVGVGTRQHTLRNPTDADVHVPAAGFSLAGTVTTPPAAKEARHPAIVLIQGSGPLDRDETVAGIPIFAQLAGQLAARGFVVLRYDKRGVGQSGGRTETATLRDYADDAIAAVKWMERRKDVDKKRVALAGHSEGAAVAMLAARDDRIWALVLMSGMGTTGKELILEQQQHLLALAKAAEPDRTEKVELQKKLLEAVTAQKGWEALPPELRGLVDTPWYRSLLLFDPAQAMKDVEQPTLILQGALDTQVPPHHAEKLAELARARKKKAPVDVHVLPGLNHLFVPARTGEVSEYGSLGATEISPDLARLAGDWLSGLRPR